MTKHEDQYEYYRCLHHDFKESYKQINKYVGELYLLPKRFIEETGPTLEKYLKDSSIPGSPDKQAASSQGVLEFINQLDSFTAETIELFNEHKNHANKSETYMKRVEDVRTKNQGRIISEYAIEFIELTPELTNLHSGLKHIKERADSMVGKLDRLETRWDTIKTKIFE